MFESKSTFSSTCKCHTMKVYRGTCTFRTSVLYANGWSVHFKPLPCLNIWSQVISLQLLSSTVNCVTHILEILGLQFSMVSNFTQA